MPKFTDPPPALLWLEAYKQLQNPELVDQKHLQQRILLDDLPLEDKPGLGLMIRTKAILDCFPYLEISSDGRISRRKESQPGRDSVKRQPDNPEQERVRPVMCELWSPDGMPPDYLTDSRVLNAVDRKLKEKNQPSTSRSTIRRLRGRE